MWRSMFTPIIQILQIDFPELDLIHSVSTGYGGLLGAAISAKSDIPFILGSVKKKYYNLLGYQLNIKKDGFLSFITCLIKHMNKPLM
ncbi:DUF3492 domain-containing protein [Bacillus mycoides]